MTENQHHIPFAVMINGRSIKRWQADSIQKLTESGKCSCVLFISNPDEHEEKKSFLRKLFNRHFLFNFLLNRVFSVDAEKSIPIPEGIPVMEVNASCKGVSQYISESDIEQIKSFQPSFILRFGYNILRGDILNAAPYGIWSFHHGDERRFRGGPFGFHEIRTRTHVTGVILQRLNSKLDAGHVLLRREYITVMHSWKEMRQRLLGENTDMPLLAVNQYIAGKEVIPEPSVTKAPIYKSPGNFGMLQFVCRLWRNRLKFHFRRLFVYENWHVQYGMTFNTPLVPVLPGVTTVSARKGSEFYADPFILQTTENQYILFEKFSYRGRKGCISAAIPGKDSFDWLVKDTHLAYPFVFNHEGVTWVIPENAESGKCMAYRVDNKLNIIDETTLLNLPVVDPSFLFHEGRFYLFCGLKDQLPNEKLFIFWSDTLEGPYKPHLMNPVKVTPVGSRSGGNLKIWQGDYYRPTQVSDIYYGHKILINKIISLSPEVFVEHEFCEINPAVFGSEFCGLHTYTTDGNNYVVDLKTHRLGLSAFRFRWKLNRRKGRSDA